MKRIAIALPLFLASLVPALSVAQSGPQYGAPQTPAPGILEWNPPALTQLSEMATTRSSFTLDKPMLSAAAGLWPDQDNQTRQAINKIDGVSVHLLRFSDYGVPE